MALSADEVHVWKTYLKKAYPHNSVPFSIFCRAYSQKVVGRWCFLLDKFGGPLASMAVK